MVNSYRKEITALGEALEGEDAKIAGLRNALRVELAKAEVSKASMDEFHSNITKFWSAVSQRVLWHVLYAPPISIPSQQQTIYGRLGSC